MSPQRPSDILPAEVLEKVRKLELFSRLRVESYLSGENRSKRTGFSTDFVSHRPYLPGDDLRRVDWRAYARTDRFVVKQFEELTSFELTLVLDVSNSMAFGDELTKHSYVVRCCAIVLFLAYLQRDSFSLYFFDDRLTGRTAKGGGYEHLLRCLGELVSAEPSGRTSFERSFGELEREIRRSGLLFVFSDCMDEPATIAGALAPFRMKGTDVVLFGVYHPAEKELPYNDVTRFICLESGRITVVDPLEVERRYREEFIEHHRALKAQMVKHGMDYCELEVSGSYEEALGEYLLRRMELYG